MPCWAVERRPAGTIFSAIPGGIVSLYHWDPPLELMEHRGWLIRDTAERWRTHSEPALSTLGDRGVAWTTLGELLLHTAYGHAARIA